MTHSACPAVLIARYDRLTMNELQIARLAIEADSENRNPPGSFQIYKPRARSKLEAIAWAITHRLAEMKREVVT